MEEKPEEPIEPVVLGDGLADPQPPRVVSSKIKGNLRALSILGMAMSLQNRNVHPQSVADISTLLNFDPYMDFKYEEMRPPKPCMICGQPSTDSKDFCSAKHATLYYQNQKASGTYKGDRKLPRSKRKKK